jgi:putative FmdB family regulatory protein
MPTYSAKCTNEACGHKFDIYRRIADRDLPANCEKCRAPAQRIIDKARVAVDYAPYTCPISGEIISGRRQHEENLKRHGCRVYESGELDEHKRYRQAEAEAAEDAIVESAVAAALALPQEKQEILTGELLAGAGEGDCGFVRATATTV